MRYTNRRIYTIGVSLGRVSSPHNNRNDIGLRIQYVYLRFIAYRIINIVFNVFQKCCLFIQSYLYIHIIYKHTRWAPV